VLLSRIRVVVLGLLAVMLVGSAMASTASAEAGPFFHHRPVGGKGEGEKIESKAPENFSGVQGEQTLFGEIAAIKVAIAAPSATVSGALFNSLNQGQFKITITYKESKLVKPVLKECTSTIGTNNVLVLKGHMEWKWNGTPAQLAAEPQAKEQVPEFVVASVEPLQKGTSDFRKNGAFTTITLKGTGCGVLAGNFNIEGSEVGFLNRKIEEWSKTLAFRTTEDETINKEAGEGEGFLQHDWNGSAFQGIIAGLKFGGSPADLIGQTEIESTQQEIAIFEK
jgi:hypothetical protein